MAQLRRRRTQPKATAPQQLVETLQQGGITLVLGAGVSMPRGVPSWPELVRRMWKEAFGAPPGEEVLPAQGNPPHPQTLPMAFECIEEALGTMRFRSLMRSQLRGSDTPVPGETLAPVAKALMTEQARAIPRILRVITFNADDLLEREVHGDPEHLRRAPIIWPIVRESGHVRRERGFGGRPPIPVYHLHGFVPSHARWLWHEEAAESLIFTDAQYWASVASPASFANRVMMHALHDSHCVFLGLSMTDINLMRWFALRAAAVTQDKARQFADHPQGLAQATQQALLRHFWIRRRPPPGDDLLGRHLARRGVQSVEVAEWKDVAQLLALGSQDTLTPARAP